MNTKESKLLHLYSKDKISATRIKTILDINQYQFMQLLSDNDINYRVGELTLEEQKENQKVLKELLGQNREDN